uniref:Uncharacterized protein n=1 Tax=Arundo donax TaxID=35708 RepID=A0A0A9HT11_ARUDO
MSSSRVARHVASYSALRSVRVYISTSAATVLRQGTSVKRGHVVCSDTVHVNRTHGHETRIVAMQRQELVPWASG